MSDQKRGTDQDPSKPPRNPPTTTNPPSQPQPPSQFQQQQQQQPPSLASRIQSSAAGLARNAFSSSSSADAHLLNGNTTTTKPSSSAASTAALSAAHQYSQETSSTTSSATANHASTAYPGETFRSAQGQHTRHSAGGFELPPLTTDEFQHAPIDIADANLVTTTKGKGKQPATQSPTPAAAPAPAPTLLSSDGDAVVSLLSSPTFSPEFPHEASDEPFEPVETDLSETLSPAELQMIQSFRRQLHQTDPSYNGQGTRHAPLTSLSLVPDIDTILSSAPSSTLADATALRDAVLTGLPGAADWVAVEDRYHDEVWGYLRPALEAAKKELEDKAGGSEEEGPAVRRLKMILKHMQA